MIELGDFISKNDRIRSDIRFLNKTLDAKRNYYDLESGKYEYKQYLKNKLSNPVATDIAMQENLRKNPLLNPYKYRYRLFRLERMPEFDVLRKQVEAIDKQHAKTLPIRQKLIELRRIELDHITPKVEGMKKLLLKLKVNF